MTVTSKFKKDITTLRSGVDGEFFLDERSELYKKVRKYYENNGVTFSGDPLDDYDILIDCLKPEDLNSSVELTSSLLLDYECSIESQGYRFIENGTIELDGLPDYRLQEKNEFTKRWNDSISLIIRTSVCWLWRTSSIVIGLLVNLHTDITISLG